MKKTFLAGILAASVAFPTGSVCAADVLQGAGQDLKLAVQDLKPEPVYVVRPAQVLAIGAGVIVGIAVMEALIPTALGYTAGGIVGGYLANVWYGGRQPI
jgi:hypothetical protein